MTPAAIAFESLITAAPVGSKSIVVSTRSWSTTSTIRKVLFNNLSNGTDTIFFTDGIMKDDIEEILFVGALDFAMESSFKFI